MSSSVSYSTEFDRLVQALVEAVGHPSTDSPGSWIEQWRKPAVVLVPSLDVGGYLRLAVAQHGGATVNYRFETLQSFLNHHIENRAAGDEVPAFEVLNREVMKTVLLDVLEAPSELEGELTPVADYILADEGKVEGTVDVRRYQLARQIATIFEEYIYSRPDLLAGWEADPVRYAFSDEGAAADIERWQAELWRRLRQAVDNGVTERDYLPIPEAFERAKDAIGETLVRELRGGTLHVFGFAGFGRQFLEMLVELSDRVDVRFYFHGPAREHFVEQAKGRPWREMVSGDVTPSVNMHPALRSWGKVGAETIYQLHDTGVEFEMLGDPHSGSDSDRLLPVFQNALDVGAPMSRVETGSQAADGGGRVENDEDALADVADGGRVQELARDLEAVVDGAAPDDSIKFIEAPGLRRELEIVANEIWQTVGASDDLAFSDVAVAVPEGKAETYIAHLRSAFDEFHELPFTVNSMSLAGNTPVMDAVEMLLDLPDSSFTRSELLALAVHPNVIEQFDVDAETWVDWADDLNILYGADRDDQRRNGSHYLQDDLFNWDQGMRRLALGAFLDVPERREEATLEVDGHDYVPESVSLQEIDAASAFDVLVESLVEDARWLREHCATLEEWAEILSKTVEVYLVPTVDTGADYDEDERVIHRVTTALEELAELPDIGEVSYRTAKLYAADRLAELQTGTPFKFTDGVVVSTPDRLRGLPFEHTFVVGMGEGMFPASDPRSELDLRTVEPKVGDIQPSDRDSYHFLEMLQSANRSLTLSWVGRESTTGESLPESPLIGELKRRLPLSEDQIDQLVEVHPLRRYDRHADYFREFDLPPDKRPGSKDVPEEGLGPNYHPEAFREAQMSAVRERLEDQREGSGREIWTRRAFLEVQERFADAVSARGESSNNRESGRMLRVSVPPQSFEEAFPPPSTSLPGEMRLSKLSQFLKKPLQTKAKLIASIYSDDEDALVHELEAFELDALNKAIIGNRMGDRMLADGGEPDETEVRAFYRLVATEQYAPGDLPVGVFGNVASAKLVENIATAGRNLGEYFASKLGLDLSTEPQRYCFASRPTEGEFPALEVPLDQSNDDELASVQLVGETPILVSSTYPGERGAFLKLSRSGGVKSRDFLSGYVAHLVLSAYGDGYASTGRRMVVIPAKTWSNGPRDSTIQKSERRFAQLGQQEARDYLSRLLSEMLLTPEFELFPFEVAEAFAEVEAPFDREDAWVKALQKDTGGGKGGIRTQYGPVHDYLDYPPPDDPAQTIRNRFAYHLTFGSCRSDQGGS